MVLERDDFNLVTDFMCRVPIENELGTEKDWNWMSTKKVGFKIKKKIKEPANMNLLQAALAVVIYNDAECYNRRSGGRRFVKRDTIERYYGEWEAMTESFLESHPEFDAQNWRDYLKKR